ncbi:MAG: histidinol-phosphate transaminase [Sedimentisphaerales bacterium]|nr:histidinol-phosphate transaminase [Sedimentisphaerales bacterium]
MKFRFRENVERLKGYVPGFQPRDATVIKLNTNENPYPVSPRVLAAIGKMNEEQLRRYPPVYWDDFREAVSEVFGFDPEMVFCSNGGDEILTVLVRCCCEKDRALAYPVPTYTLYRELAKIQDCPVVEVPFENFERVPKGLAEAGAALTILCNPNAPTGTMISIDRVADLAASVKGVLLIDEAYVDFAESDCLSLVEDFDNVVVLRSLSKGYSLAGMRLGFAVGSPRIIDAMCKVKDSYNLNCVAQVAAAAALRDQEHFYGNVDKVLAERTKLTAALRAMGLKLRNSQTNFLLVEFVSPTASEVYAKLLDKYIYVRYFDEDGLRDKLRITVGTTAENDALLVTLKDILANHGG